MTSIHFGKKNGVLYWDDEITQYIGRVGRIRIPTLAWTTDLDGLFSVLSRTLHPPTSIQARSAAARLSCLPPLMIKTIHGQLKAYATTART